MLSQAVTPKSQVPELLGWGGGDYTLGTTGTFPLPGYHMSLCSLLRQATDIPMRALENHAIWVLDPVPAPTAVGLQISATPAFLHLLRGPHVCLPGMSMIMDYKLSIDSGTYTRGAIVGSGGRLDC